MKIAFTYLLALTLIMGGALAYGFTVGDFWQDGGKLIDNPWGIVSLFDVYVGFFFFIGWIWYRQFQSALGEMWSQVFMRLSPSTKVRAMPLFSLWATVNPLVPQKKKKPSFFKVCSTPFSTTLVIARAYARGDPL